MAVVRQRVSKEFELRGTVTTKRAGRDKNGSHYVLLAVSGFTFFLPEEFHGESNLIHEGDYILVKGEYAGDTVRNGNRQPTFEIYELRSDIEGFKHNGYSNGATIPKLEKGAQAA